MGESAKHALKTRIWGLSVFWVFFIYFSSFWKLGTILAVAGSRLRLGPVNIFYTTTCGVVLCSKIEHNPPIAVVDIRCLIGSWPLPLPCCPRPAPCRRRARPAEGHGRARHDHISSGHRKGGGGHGRVWIIIIISIPHPAQFFENRRFSIFLLTFTMNTFIR